MDVVLDRKWIPVAPGDDLDATALVPQQELPAVLFVHGWGGSQRQDLGRAREITGLGCVCLTFDLRGHRENAVRWNTITRPENLKDLCAAYDWLAAQANVDPDAMAVVGISYGGYLAAILTELRPVRWLVLRTPAIYLDRDWDLPKRRLHDDPELLRYRNRDVDPEANRALRACATFQGDVLLIEAEHDEIIPHKVIENYVSAFGVAASMTRRVIEGADHGFEDKAAQRQYTDVLTKWITEMIVGTRGKIAASKVDEHKRERESADAV